MKQQIQKRTQGRRMSPEVITAILGGLYVASPIDLLPDFVPLLGQLDDIAVIFLAMAAIVVMLLTRGDDDENK